jgi:hypothetical protein
MEEPILILTVLVTIAFAALAVLCAVGGISTRRGEGARFFAPVAVVPTLALLGALVCSWGLGFLVAMFGPEFEGHAWWAWLIGLPIGGFLGRRLGCSLVRSFRKKHGMPAQA